MKRRCSFYVYKDHKAKAKAKAAADGKVASLGPSDFSFFSS